MNSFPPQRISMHSPPNYQTQQGQAENSMDQLRRENLFLKHQLSSLLKTEPSQHSIKTTHTSPEPCVINNREVEVEDSFRRKMSRLKNRSSNRRASDRDVQTMPNSPSKGHTEMPNRCSQQEGLAYNGHGFKKQPSSFRMVIQQTPNGKYYRDKSQEEDPITPAHRVENIAPRNVLRSPRDQLQNKTSTPRLNFTSFPCELNVNSKPPPTPKGHGHKRYESSFECSAMNRVDTNHQLFKRCSEAIRSQKVNFFKEQKQHREQVQQREREREQERAHYEAIDYHSRQSIRSPRQITTLEQERVHKDMKENIRPSLHSPRGRAYIEKLQAQERMSASQSQSSDSFLSIDRGMNLPKASRRLRCDIYLADQA